MYNQVKRQSIFQTIMEENSALTIKVVRSMHTKKNLLETLVLIIRNRVPPAKQCSFFYFAKIIFSFFYSKRNLFS